MANFLIWLRDEFMNSNQWKTFGDIVAEKMNSLTKIVFNAVLKMVDARLKASN